MSEEQYQKLSIQDLKLIDLYTEISLNTATINDAAYMHVSMCQLGLPRSLKSVKGKDTFERQCGHCSIRIQAGALWDGHQWVQQPIPYGPIPRLLLAIINRIAVTERTKIIELGSSWTKILRILGKGEPTGGNNGNLTKLKKEMLALLACEFKLGFIRNGQPITFDNKPIKEYGLWYTEQSASLEEITPSTIVLSDEYYSALIDDRAAIPFDMRAVVGLSHSALAIDIYLMLTERLHRLAKSQTLTWRLLKGQFGQEYIGVHSDRTFKRKFITAFKAVKMAYPECKSELKPHGLELVPSPPPIPKMLS